MKPELPLDQTIRFIVPVALRQVMEQLLPAFQHQTGCRFDLVHMLNPEVPAYADGVSAWDIAITNPCYIECMVEAGHVRQNEHYELGYSPLAFGKRWRTSAEPVTSLSCIASLLAGAPSIAITDVGTSGAMFRSLAQKLEVWDQIEQRVVGLEGGGPMRALQAGEVEVAALPLSNIAPVADVHTAGVCSLELGVHIDLSIGLHTGAHDAARTFCTWLLDNDRAEDMRRLGVVPAD